jgi:SWI/SNF-related matrix-associated actin-dependent regulator 1 of chromatin subfamily A
MSDKAKDDAVKDFQHPLGGAIFIGQIQSAGTGITLTAARVVVFAESSWSPGEIEQVIDRCHRIGQEGEVEAYFLTTKDSIDERMLLVAIGKQGNINKIMG